MKRRILLVDDEVAVLLTLKAVLEISGFDVDTAASGREGMSKIHTRQYDMLITDMRMETDAAGVEVIRAARTAPYHPAVALLTAFPVAEEDWQEMGADQLLVKPMHTRILLAQIEELLTSHQRRLAEKGITIAPPVPAEKTAAKKTAKKSSAKKPAARKAVAKKIAAKASVKKSAPSAKKAAAKKAPAKTKKPVVNKSAVKKVTAKKAPAKKTSAKKSPANAAKAPSKKTASKR